MLQSNMADDTMFVRVVNEIMNVIDFVELIGISLRMSCYVRNYLCVVK